MGQDVDRFAGFLVAAIASISARPCRPISWLIPHLFGDCTGTPIGRLDTAVGANCRASLHLIERPFQIDRRRRRRDQAFYTPDRAPHRTIGAHRSATP